MRDFFLFIRRTLRDRALLGVAFVFALISAVGTGVGLMSMIPVMRLILGESGDDGGGEPGVESEGASLVSMAEEFNASGEGFLGIPFVVPQWVVDVLPAGRLEGVMLLVGVIAGLTVFGATANFLHQYFSITVATRTIANARAEAFRVTLFMPLIRVTGRGASEFIARIIRDAAELHRGLIALTSKSIAHVTQGLAAFAVALAVGGRLTLIALVVVPLLVIVLRKLGKRIRRGARGALQGQEDLLRVATEAVQGLRAVKVNTIEERTMERFAAMNREVVRQELRARIARAMSGPIMETLAVLVVGGLAILSVKFILDGTIEKEQFVLALGSLALAGSRFKMLAGLINEMQAASAPAKRLMDVLDEPPEAPAPGKNPASGKNPGIPLPSPPPAPGKGEGTRKSLPRHEESIRFEEVSFTYPGQEEPVLREVSFTVKHGERMAIVGPNGCGKTTLLSMIPRLIVPGEGRVLVDGVDLASVSLESLRRQIGVVTQETVLFRGSVADNIDPRKMAIEGEGGIERAVDPGVVEAAKKAHAHEFIFNMREGYQTNVAEQGLSLSGGQRQRLAIARAILRDPAILILDEATSQIDAESEHHIHESITEFGVGRTVLIIAHRLSTVLDADRILVMEGGRVIDEGRHEVLLERCDLYRRLAKTQLVSGGA